MKSLDEIEEDLYLGKIVNHRHLLLELFQEVVMEIRKCSRCKKNKKLEKALNKLMVKALYTKRKDD